MGDRTRLFLTGIAAAGAVAVTVAAPAPWRWFDGDEERSVSAPLASLRDFDGIVQQGPDTVIVTPGRDFSVTMDGDPKALKRVTLSVHGGALRVGRRGTDGWWGAGSKPVTVRVTMPSLARVWITGSGTIQANGINAKEFAARLDGSGDLKVANIDSNAVRLSLNGSGKMDLAGHADAVSAVLVGSGDVQAQALGARTADISVTGSGEVHAQASQSAKLAVRGSGHAQVDGTNRCRIQKTGSGDAECTS